MAIHETTAARPARVEPKAASAPRKPTRPSRIPEAGATACASCNIVASHRVELVHQGSGTPMTVCLRCLRSSMQMKADLSESKGPLMLRDYAEAFGWQVWTSRDVAYLLPSVAPFVGPALAPAIKPGV